jgi:hypothetical protein|tara:strand:+ start:190 stop:492 length:303 start_codon:yes stop_codon:yes gene_type:complete
MAEQTVAEVLTAATDSVTVINDINSKGKKSEFVGGSSEADTDMSQADINEVVQRNVDHLEAILAYDGENNTPNVKGSSSSKKNDCSTAITTGKAYISSNS